VGITVVVITGELLALTKVPEGVVCKVISTE